MTKVFWSWQSDRPGKTGRHFVRDALQDAISAIMADGNLEESQRDLHLDHDRKGASGSPDLARLILDKIKASTIFVADVTNIGQSDEAGDNAQPKSLMNPNVAIELGYALATIGDAGLLMVMNEAYGGRRTLPFDLSHKAGPIFYNLKANATKPEIESAKKALVQKLKEAIHECVVSSHGNEADITSPPPFIPTPPKNGLARFRAKGEALGATDPFPLPSPGEDITLADGPAVWLHVFPAIDSGYHRWAPTLRTSIRNQFATLMMPLGSYASTYRFVTAVDGFGMVSMLQEGTAEAVTFAFERGEIWGINAFMLDASGIRPRDQGPGIIPFAHTVIVEAFKNFTALLRRPMEVPMPYRWILGMEDLKGRQLVIPTPSGLWSNPMGRCLVDEIVEEGTYQADESHYRCLRPFFEKLVSRCALDPNDIMKGYPD
jgi:hypothetical protein